MKCQNQSLLVLLSQQNFCVKKKILICCLNTYNKKNNYKWIINGKHKIFKLYTYVNMYLTIVHFSLKKSTTQQLRTLVLFMEENPELARGAPVFGANKFSIDEEWKKLGNNLNALGPPTRTIAEWKKVSMFVCMYAREETY